MDKVLAVRGLPQIIRKMGLEWTEKLQFIETHMPGRDTYSLDRISQLALTAAESLKLKHLESKAKSWQAFVDKQLRSGAAATHRLVKRDASQCLDTATVGTGEDRTASPQKILEQDLEEWRAIWCGPNSSKGAPWRGCKVDDAGVQEITAEQVARAARTFPVETSIGCDSYPPSTFASFSLELRQCIADFLNLLEEEGEWPHEAATALIHLIPKTDGGRRPIGVLPSIVRIWERIRKPIVRDWMRRNSRSYDWTSQGRSSEGAAWHQSLLDEAAKADGLASAAALMDLSKAFERVALHHVWAAGVRHGFPLRILKLILEAFAFARRLSYQGSISEAILTLSAVLAGGGFAQVALYLVLLDPIDQVQVTYPIGVTICTYVDDIGVHVVGHESVVATVIAACTDDIIQRLEQDLDMKVSRRDAWSTTGKAKTVVAVSSSTLARRLATPMRRLGALITRKAKHLGVEFRPGARTRTTPSSSRWAANAARRARTQRLGRRLGKRVFSTGLKPAVMYGATVAALGAGTIAAMRRSAGRALGKIRGRSLTARLAVNQCDPGWDAVRGPIMAWTTEAWTSRVPRRTMQRAWMQGQITVNRSSRHHMSSGGAAGAFFTAINAVGWRSPAYNVVITADGTSIDLSQEAPRTVERFLRDDYSITSSSSTSIAKTMNSSPADRVGGYAARCHAADGTTYEQYNGNVVPWFEPAASVVNSVKCRAMAPSAVASVASIPEGGWWTQAKLFQVGLAEDPFCRLCGTAEGTLHHRLFRCPARRQAMESKCPDNLLQKAVEESEDPLYTIGVPRRPKCPPPPQAAEAWVGTPPPDGAVAAGEAFTDGALRGTVPKARRGGWAFVVLNGHEPIWGKFGNCSDTYLTVLRTELRALAEILRITTGPIVIHVDNSQVVDGVANGRSWCCSPKRDGSDIWREIWDRLDQLPGLVTVQKVKAHLSYSDVASGRISWHKWIGNGLADLWAKRGSAEAERLSPCSWIQGEWSRARAVYKWALLVASEWMCDTGSSAVEAARPDVSPPATRPKRILRDNAASHELWKNASHGWCRLCGIEAPWLQVRPPPAFRRPCKGSMGTRCGISGREHAVSPRPHAFDEGCFSLASLRARGAEKVMHAVQPHDRSDGDRGPDAPGPPPPLGGYARGDSMRTSHRAALDVEEDDDPFGHAQLPMALDVRGDLRVDNPPLQVATSDRRADPALRVAYQSHALTRHANLVWCQTCGRHAFARLGSGLLGQCRGEATGA